jgi:hypothetical protein
MNWRCILMAMAMLYSEVAGDLVENIGGFF